MAKMQIQNRTRNPYKIPLVKGEIDNSGARMIPVGMTGEIDADKHVILMRANKAYVAMIEQKKLIVSAIQVDDVTEDELENTSDPEKPADLLANPEAEGAEGSIEAVVESKSVELIEVPADELSSQQKAANTRAVNKAAKLAAPAKKK